MNSGIVSRELLAMATAEALGDEKKTNAIYIRLRAEEIAQGELTAKTTKALEGCRNTVNKAANYTKQSIHEVVQLVVLVLKFNLFFTPMLFGLIFILKKYFGIFDKLSISYSLLLAASIVTIAAILYDNSKYPSDKDSET